MAIDRGAVVGTGCTQDCPRPRSRAVSAQVTSGGSAISNTQAAEAELAWRRTPVQAGAIAAVAATPTGTTATPSRATATPTGTTATGTTVTPTRTTATRTTVTPTGTIAATPGATATATRATASATAGLPRTTAAPVQRYLLDRKRNSLWRRSGIRSRGQADGGKAKRTCDCGGASHSH
jgi:hypothetical protein